MNWLLKERTNNKKSPLVNHFTTGLGISNTQTFRGQNIGAKKKRAPGIL
jgi:hypothetical protein